MFVTVAAADGRAEGLPVEGSTAIADLLSLAASLFGLDPSSAALVHNQTPLNPALTLDAAGVKDGDMLLIMNAAPPAPAPAPAPAMQSGGLGAGAVAGGGGAGGLGAIDFGSLLGGGGGAAGGGGGGGGGGGLNLLPVNARMQSAPVEWAGMSLDDAFSNNTNPRFLVQIFKTHPNVLKELNYHNPKMAAVMRDSPEEEAVQVMRDHILAQGAAGFNRTYDANREETEMKNRLLTNPMDPTANEYFGRQIEQKNIMEQYTQTMNEYPETFARVLMLYIATEVNGKPVQAFVDSGAQSTIMSSACAERLDILRLVDKRFEGVAVGVGSGKILGRIHLVNLKVKGEDGGMGGEDVHLPCSITVMDSEKGLGDKNMDFLFGLDMLKRHRCSIDLQRNALVLNTMGRQVVTPFLQEYQLDTTKGGTRDFDADAANAELEKAQMDSVAEVEAAELAEAEAKSAEETGVAAAGADDTTMTDAPGAGAGAGAASAGAASASAPAPAAPSPAPSPAPAAPAPSASPASAPAAAPALSPAPTAAAAGGGGGLGFTLDFSALGAAPAPAPAPVPAAAAGSGVGGGGGQEEFRRLFQQFVAMGHDPNTATALALQQLAQAQAQAQRRP